MLVSVRIALLLTEWQVQQKIPNANKNFSVHTLNPRKCRSSCPEGCLFSGFPRKQNTKIIYKKLPHNNYIKI